MEWQLIETAPKDGTIILAYPHYQVTRWSDECFTSDGFGWAFCWEDVVDAFIPLKGVTHWMPLPAPPFTEKE